MISRINGNNGMYGNQALMNQFRVNQIMQNRFSGSSAVSPVSKLPSVGSNSSSNSSISDSIDYIKSYSSTMTDLMSSANALRSGNTGSVTSKLSAMSSDTAVMDASNSYRLTSDKAYEVNVSQIAASQVNLSEAVSSSQKATSDISMQLMIGDKSVSVDVAASADGVQKSNSQMLSEAAGQINASGSGLKASVVTKDGNSSLKIESSKTGTSNSFLVSGSFAESGKGGMSNVTQSAQNANYTITENGVSRSAVSESNKVNIGYNGIQATFKKEGTATISGGTDPAKIVSAVEDLVKSYSSAVSLLSKNSDRGYGTARQLNKLQSSVLGSEESRKHLGLSVDKDGLLSLDKTTLSESLKKDPKLTKDLVSGSFGLGQRTFTSAQSSLNTSVSNLINKDLAQAQYEQESDPMNHMNYYSRSGAFNMMNYYAVGSMFNTFV